MISPARSTCRRAIALIFAPIVSVCGGGDAGGPSAPNSPAARVPTTLTLLSTASITGSAGAVVTDPIIIRVSDASGAGIANVAVSWNATGASVRGLTAVSDASGQARAEVTAGTQAGNAEVVATVGTLAPLKITMTVNAGAAAAIQAAGGTGQSAEASSALSTQLSARVVDQYQNGVSGAPVSWQVVTGNGQLTGAQSVTDAEGIARATWALGSQVGTQTVRATSGSLAPVTFTATAVDPNGQNLTIAASYINQVVQNLAGSVPLVANKAGLLRVFVKARNTNTDRPSVRVKFYQDGVAYDSSTIAAPTNSVPTAVNEDNLAGSYNVVIPAERIKAGFGYSVQVDPDNAIVETTKNDNRFPAADAHKPTVATMPAFNVRFLSIVTGDGRAGDVSASNIESYLANARRILPTSTINVEFRAPFTVSAQSLTADNWSAILAELKALQAAEQGGRYYYGVVKKAYVGPGAGIGTLGVPPNNTLFAAMGIDDPDRRAGVAMHEWGHNFGRKHAPCGEVADPDGNFPYAGARIGQTGYDAVSNTLKPRTHYDLMSYCEEAWISDYTYQGVFGAHVARGKPVTGAPGGALIVWGRSSAAELVLEPAFNSTVPALMPSGTGSHKLEGFDVAGNRLWVFQFEPDQVGHSDDDASGNFAFALPAHVVTPERLARIRLSSQGRIAEQSVRENTNQASAGVRLGVVADNSVLSWNAEAFPFAVVRDAGSGEILAFARNGKVRIPEAVRTVDVEVSTGVNSRRYRLTK